MTHLICGILAAAAAAVLVWVIYCAATAPVHDEERDGPWVPPVK